MTRPEELLALARKVSSGDLYQEMANSHPSLKRGMVWCRVCGRSEQVNSAVALRHGWPKCHGRTMTLDDPSTWPRALAAKEAS